MEREELLKSKEYWMVQIQNDLYGIIEKFAEQNKLNRTQLAKHFGVSKGYISQIFKGDFDHKLSTLVDLSLSSNYVPLLFFVNADQYVADDANDMEYNVWTTNKTKPLEFSRDSTSTVPANKDEIYAYF